MYPWSGFNFAQFDYPQSFYYKQKVFYGFSDTRDFSDKNDYHFPIQSNISSILEKKFGNSISGRV